MVKNKKVVLLTVFGLAFIVRCLFLGVFPKGIDADEAYAGYEAYALLNYGVDSWGYSNPVYLKTWGSGMSVLYSLLVMPFISLFGVSVTAVRLPQCILGCATVVLFYKVLKKLVSDDFALWGSFLLAVSPWHIVMSRYGLDCNLAPFMLLFSVYLTILALEKPGFYPAAAVGWGMSLYSYAILWIFVPFFLAGLLFYMMFCKKLPKAKYLAAFILILFCIACPLLLFVAVNMGFISEIHTRIISIPMLTVYRADEISFGNIFSNIKILMRIFIRQEDSMRNVVPHFGIFYLISVPFMLYGGFEYAKDAFRKLRDRRLGYEAPLLLWIVIYLVTGMFANMAVHRINGIFLPLYVLLARGTHDLAVRWGNRVRNVLAGAYVLCFAFFCFYYVTLYQDGIGFLQNAGYDSAIAYALEQYDGSGDGKIYVTGQIRHSQVLFATEYSPYDFMESNKWEAYPARWLRSEGFGPFTWDEELSETNDICIIMENEAAGYEAAGYTVRCFGQCAVAVKALQKNNQSKQRFSYIGLSGYLSANPKE